MDYPSWAKYEIVHLRSDVLTKASRGDAHVRQVSNEFHLDGPRFDGPDDEVYILHDVQAGSFKIGDGEIDVIYRIQHQCCGSCQAKRGDIAPA